MAVDEIENKTWEAVTGSRSQNKKETTASGFQRYFVFLFLTAMGLEAEHIFLLLYFSFARSVQPWPSKE